VAAGNSISPGEVVQSAPAIPLSGVIHSASLDVLETAASDPALSEELALALLQRADLPAEILGRISKNGGVIKQRRVKLALVQHPKTPRHISIPLLRQLFTFDLMRVALTPAVPADIKMIADEALINRLETIPSGERLSLAKRGSGRVAAELLLDCEPRVARAALENSRLTEALVVKALMQRNAPAAFVETVSHHSKWSLRYEIRVALLRNEKTPLARGLEFARALPPGLLREVLHNSRLTANTRSLLLKDVALDGAKE